MLSGGGIIIGFTSSIFVVAWTGIYLTQNGDITSHYRTKVNDFRRIKIKQMMQHAWASYRKYAWGENELKPFSKRPHFNSVFGTTKFAATILDGLDTLYIMGMEDEYKEGRDWIANTFDPNKLTGEVSVFETNIRFVGGLLALYSLTGDNLYKNRAQQIADKLLPAFDTDTGIPHALINMQTGTSNNYKWASNECSILSEFGTLHLEFAYLSDVTGNETYRRKIDHIRDVLQRLDKHKGLYPNYLNPKTGQWGQRHMSMGGLGDSFFEYLLKAWLQSNREDVEARQMFDDAMRAILREMLKVSARNHWMYFADLKYDHIEHKMDHLACFSGGLLALAAQTLANEQSPLYMEIAANVTHTCYQAYNQSDTKLGPEAFRFTNDMEARAHKNNEKYYILRPETIESYFYLYRYTHDPKYREWGWEAVQALERYCRLEGGYTGIKNVYNIDSPQDDVQQSYFLAETLKYLYLLYSNDDLFPLDQWVFNTEGHPLPIKTINPFYREHSSL